MQAYILHNESEGTVTLKGIGTLPKIVVKRGDQYLFNSPQEFTAYKAQVERLISARMIKMETVQPKSTKSVSVGNVASQVQAPSKDEAVKPTHDLPETKEELRALLKVAQAEYKDGVNAEDKAILKDKILLIKEKISALA